MPVSTQADVTTKVSQASNNLCILNVIICSQVLGLGTGDAHIIRNAGGIATDDAIRSLIISHELLGTQEFAIINHTDCGMLKFTDTDSKRTDRKIQI